MKKSDSFQTKTPFVKWMLLGIPVLFILAPPLHFIFEWTKQMLAVGLFAPVNESPWEHLKLTFWPILIWWIIGYLCFGRKQEKCFKRYALTCCVAELVSLLFIIAFFYTYTGAFGIESLIIDIISLLLGLILGIFLAIHVHAYSNPSVLLGYISLAVLIIIGGALILFTFMPPHLPVFMDPPTGMYGIIRS